MIRFVASFFFILFLYKSSSAQPVTGGIDFKKVDLKTAFSLAKEQKKSLFIEIYLTGCPHCEALAPVLTEKEVGTFYNANFISWKTEANSADSKELQKLKNVTYPEFPILFYFDSEGTLMHMATPAEMPSRQSFIQEVIGLGRDALNPVKQTAKYQERFQAGDRDFQFLISYGKYARAVKDNNALTAITDAFALKLTTGADKMSQVGFYVIQRFVNDYNNPLAAYFFGNLAGYRSKYPEKDVKEAGEAIIFHSLYGAKGGSYSAADITRMREQMVALGVPAGEASSRTLMKEIDAYLKVGDTRGAMGVFDRYRQISTTISIADYAYILKYFNEKVKDNAYLEQAPVWAEAALRIAKPEEKQSKLAADLHYELADAYMKSNRKELALETARKALAIAKAAKIGVAKYEDQVGRFK